VQLLLIFPLPLENLTLVPSERITDDDAVFNVPLDVKTSVPRKKPLKEGEPVTANNLHLPAMSEVVQTA
jgi:hypothetical protein